MSAKSIFLLLFLLTLFISSCQNKKSAVDQLRAELAAERQRLDELIAEGQSQAELAAEERRQAELAAEERRQAELAAEWTPGSINVDLKNFEDDCTRYYAKLWSPSDMSFDTLQQTFSANCQTIFLDLKDGTYVVDLYAKSTFELGLGYLCEGCPSGLISKNKVTIVKGSREDMSFTPKR